MFTEDKLNQALKLLGQILSKETSVPIHLIVCGGASLMITGILSRLTRDVDILGFAEMNASEILKIHEASSMPEPLIKAAHRVAMDLGINESWLNTGPGSLVRFGLPEGFIGRLQTVQYSPVLCISFIGRLDQIHFKLFAAADTGPGRHLEDLRALHPSEQEMELAANWSMTQDPSDGFRQVLKEMLKAIGYGQLSDKI